MVTASFSCTACFNSRSVFNSTYIQSHTRVTLTVILPMKIPTLCNTALGLEEINTLNSFRESSQVHVTTGIVTELTSDKIKNTKTMRYL